MENLKEKDFALFMNYFSGFQVWDRYGMLSREISLYNNLAGHFRKIYIFSYGNERELEYQKYLKENVEIVPKKLKVPDVVYELLLPFIYRRIIRNCSILKTNQNSGTIAPALAKIFFRKSKLIIRSGYIGSEFARLSELPFYAKAYFFIAENFSYRFCDRAFIPKSDSATLLKKYPFLKEKIVAMNNFIDTKVFTKKESQKKYDIIYIARFDAQQKNHLMLLDSIAGMGLKLLFIGRGAGKDEVATKAKERGIDLEIIEKVSNEDIPGYYNASRICAFPSAYEGNPKALLEAMSCELPIVAFQAPGISELIENGKSGLLSEMDSSKMKANIQLALSDSELAAALGKNARQYVLENFSAEKLLQKEIEIYNNL